MTPLVSRLGHVGGLVFLSIVRWVWVMGLALEIGVLGKGPEGPSNRTGLRNPI